VRAGLPRVHQGWSDPADVTTTFHEPLVVFGYLAAITLWVPKTYATRRYS
jgi:hypothetical protein